MILPRYHAISAGGTALITLFVAALAMSEKRCGGGGSDEKGPDLTKLEAIEVSVAAPSKPAKQPQKQHREAVHQVDQGVAHDDKKPPPKDDKKKPDQPKQKPDDDKNEPPSQIPPDSPDDAIGKPTSTPGQFNPNKFGNATVDKGDPYLRELVTDVLAAGGDFPKILDAQGSPLACVHLDPDGKVVDTLFKEKSGNSDLDEWVDGALDKFKKTRNENPKQVPTRLLDTITGWICFHFDLNKP